MFRRATSRPLPVRITPAAGPTITPSQAAFLVRLSPAERQVLDSDPRLRARLLAWHALGPDPILEAETRRLLARPLEAAR